VPIPWAGLTPPFGFGPNGSSASWLPAPTSWRVLTAQAQRSDPDSVLELYRAALRLRRELIDRGTLGDGTLRWLDSPAGTLVFARDGGFVCAANLGDRPVTLPRPGELLLASEPLESPSGRSGEQIVLPADIAAWWAVAGEEHLLMCAGTDVSVPAHNRD
jgi:alpha-glucosidase